MHFEILLVKCHIILYLFFLQATLFGKFTKLRDFSLSNINAVDKYDSLLKHFKNLR